MTGATGPSNTAEQLRGLAFPASALVAIFLVVLLLVDPTALDGAHPMPLLALLLVMTVVSVWQASVLLR